MYAGTPEHKRIWAERSRQYRRRHPERVAAANAAYRIANPFHSYIWAINNPEKQLLKSSRGSAKQRGLEHTITLADITVPTHCPVLGLKLEFYGEDRNSTPTIDRIDSSRGYVPGNVVVVSLRANWLKHDATLQELRKIADFYERYAK